MKASWCALVVVAALAGCASDDGAAGVPAQRLPIVFVHGFMGWRDLGPLAGEAGNYFTAGPRVLRAQGVPVFQPALPPFGSTEQRAPFVAAAIDEALRTTGARKVHVIGHSQGGIDARYVVSALGYADRVASVTTLSSPHAGTPVTELGAMLPAFLLELPFDLMGNGIAWIDGEDLGDPDIQGSLASLSKDAMARFNVDHPMPPDVPLFTVAGVTGDAADETCDDGLVFNAPTSIDAPHRFFVANWLRLRGDPNHPKLNDGVVPTASARAGTFLGCIAADHVDEMGWQPNVEMDDVASFDQPAFLARLGRFLGAFESP